MPSSLINFTYTTSSINVKNYQAVERLNKTRRKRLENYCLFCQLILSTKQLTLSDFSPNLPFRHLPRPNARLLP